MVTINSIQELVIALFEGTVSDPYDIPFSHNTCVTDRQQTDDTSYPRLDLTVVHKRYFFVL